MTTDTPALDPTEPDPTEAPLRLPAARDYIVEVAEAPLPVDAVPPHKAAGKLSKDAAADLKTLNDKIDQALASRPSTPAT